MNSQGQSASLLIAGAVVVGLVIAGIAAAVFLLGGTGSEGSGSQVVVAATVALPTATITPTPAPTPTPMPPAPEPEPAPTDRADCAAIRADPVYRSEAERLWFMANCSAPSAPAPAASAPQAAAPPPAASAPPPPPVATGPRTVTASLCDGANRGILLLKVTSGSFSYTYDASSGGLNLQPADMPSSLSIPNVPPGPYTWTSNTLTRSGGLLQVSSGTSDADRIVRTPFC